MRNNFERLCNWESWCDPESRESPNSFTTGRQQEVLGLLAKYDGRIPMEHFSDERVNDMTARDHQIFPLVYAYTAGYLEDVGDALVLKQGVKLCVHDLPRLDTLIWGRKWLKRQPDEAAPGEDS